MSRIQGNTPKCKDCKYYEDGIGEGHAKIFANGWCICKHELARGINGRLLPIPLPRRAVAWNDCCRRWVDAETGKTRYEVLTGKRECESDPADQVTMEDV